MTFGTLSDEDRRAERLRVIEESRAAHRAAPPAPRTAPPRPPAPPAFRIVDELPESGSFLGRRIPQRRRDLIDYAKAHPGKWIEYPSAEGDEYKSPSSFVGNIRNGRSGFAPKGAFDAARRGEIVYVRYIGHSNGGTL